MQRQMGLLVHEKHRNPLRAERSPRKDFAGFVYKPPDAEAIPERWGYPEIDWGLMAKFRSQQEIYNGIYKKENEYETKIKGLQKIKEENEKSIHAEFVRQRALYDLEKKVKDSEEVKRLDLMRGILPEHHHHHHHHTGTLMLGHAEDDLDLLLQGEEDNRIRENMNKKKKKSGHHMLIKLVKDPDPIIDFYKAGITRFSTIGEKHPEVLAEWRAKRAAEYVVKRGENAVLPPAQRRAQTHAFRPGGIHLAAEKTFFEFKSPSASPAKKSTSHSKVLNPLQSPKVAAAAGKAELRALRLELDKTDEAMARQELKIKLNSKFP
ncbi:hypothetical protein B484DRAFT_479169 [Ochromonadaceae sp. CCMP2298]|nr:hypothetical protein B484DRAFT_479169 [Ochromonadaceae sp. CCMP2298]